MISFSLRDAVMVADVIGEAIEWRTGVIVGLTYEKQPKYDVRLDVDGSILTMQPQHVIKPMPKREVA